MELIKNLINGRKVVFDEGKFDQWCVYIVESDGSKDAPFDNMYFEDFRDIAQKYSDNKVYDDFVRIYDETTGVIDADVINLIDEIVDTYEEADREIMEQWFTVIYAGMIAEENKEHAILKKRIKRLGMYQAIVLGMSATEAAVFSRSKKWKELDTIMNEYGF
jgi:hypothetical protein